MGKRKKVVIELVFRKRQHVGQMSVSRLNYSPDSKEHAVKIQ